MHWKLGNRFYQRSKYLVITLLISILVNLTGCGNENSDIGARQVDSDNEQIQVDIKFVEPFAPYYKIFYLETADWKKGGLEQDETLVEQYMLDQIALQKEEHIVYLAIYDYEISDYIEEIVYSLNSDDTVMFHCIVKDRQNNCIGVLSYDYAKNWENKSDSKIVLEKMVQRWTETNINSCNDEATDYSPKYYIYDVNEDDYVDLYNDTEIYLWSDTGYELCQDRENFKNNDTGTVAEDVNQEIENLTDDIKVDGQVTYLQLKNMPNAQKINKQIKEAVDKRIKTYFNLLSSIDHQNDWTDENNSENVDFKIDIYANNIVHRDEQYLTIKLEGTIIEYPVVTVNEAKGDYGFQYLTFDLETGDRVKLSDVLGTDYTAEQIKNLAWKAYQKRMEEVPDQYSKKLFDGYCRLLFDEGGWTWSPKWENTEGWPLEEYFHYYFTDNGMVITYSAKGDFAVPVIYRLNERLEPITVENGKAIQMTLDWKDIN